jgi:hypothetical protein
VVAEGDDVGTRAQQPVGELRRDACAVGDVLAVDDAEIDVELLAQSGEPLVDRTATRGPEDVREEDDPQFKTSDAAGRSSIETWLPSSVV